MNRDLKENTDVILSKNNPWLSRNVTNVSQNPINRIGSITYIEDLSNFQAPFLVNNIYVDWPDGGHNSYRHTDCDLIPIGGSYSREVLRRIARTEGLTVADLGISSEFRWQLAVKEI